MGISDQPIMIYVMDKSEDADPKVSIIIIRHGKLYTKFVNAM